jgi:hypothetical protein
MLLPQHFKTSLRVKLGNAEADWGKEPIKGEGDQFNWNVTHKEVGKEGQEEATKRMDWNWTKHDSGI